MKYSRTLTLALVLLLAFALAVGCIDEEPSAPVTIPFDAETAEELRLIGQGVANLRELPMHPDLESGWLPRENLSAWLDEEIAAIPPEELREIEQGAAILYLLGMIESKADFIELVTSITEFGTVGLYFDDADLLGVVGEPRALSDGDRETLVHELVHSLQDAHLQGGEWELLVDGGNRDAPPLAEYSSTLSCLREGDATFTTGLYAAAVGLDPDPEVLDAETLALLEQLPPALLHYSAFDYTSCARFIEEIYESGGWAAVNQAFVEPPTTTEQVLHPRKFRSREGSTIADPPDLTVPLGDGWELQTTDPFGELDVLTLLAASLSTDAMLDHVQSQFEEAIAIGALSSDDVGEVHSFIDGWSIRAFAGAELAAAGWGGGAVSLYASPEGDEVVHVTLEWDSLEDYAQFAEALELTAEGNAIEEDFTSELDQTSWRWPNGHGFAAWDDQALSHHLIFAESFDLVQELSVALAAVTDLTPLRGPFVSAVPLPDESELPPFVAARRDCDGTDPRVCLVPVGTGLPIDLDSVAQRIEEVTGVEVIVARAIPVVKAANGRSVVDPSRGQLRASGVFELLRIAFPDQANAPGVTVVAVTAHDLYNGDSDTDWTFEWSSDDRSHYVVSSARLDDANYGLAPHLERLTERVTKLVAGGIGQQLYGLGWSNDRRSPMYSDAVTLAAIDQIDLDALSALVRGIELTTESDAADSAGEPVATPSVPSLDPPVDLVVADSHSCAVLQSGRVACWGENSRFALGVDDRDLATMDGVFAQTAPSLVVDAMNHHSCAVGSDGTLDCWGNSADFDHEGIDGLSGIVSVGVGWRHACAVDAEGRIWCWGGSGYGEAGATEPVAEPTLVEHSIPGRVVKVDAGMSFTCALTDAGEVYCWGLNEAGQLGLGRRVDDFSRSEPSRVDHGSSSRLTQDFSAGLAHVCLQTVEDRVLCWGSNEQQQVSGVSTDPHRTPSAVGVGDQIVQIAAGGVHSCAILERDRSVVCWGDNSSGALGRITEGPIERHPGPVEGIPPARVIAAGFGQTCIISVLDEIWCWGSSPYGRAATAAYEPRLVALPD